MSIKLTKAEIDNIIFDAKHENSGFEPFPFDSQPVQVKRSFRRTDGRFIKVCIDNKDLTYSDIRIVSPDDAKELLLASEWNDFR